MSSPHHDRRRTLLRSGAPTAALVMLMASAVLFGACGDKRGKGNAGGGDSTARTPDHSTGATPTLSEDELRALLIRGHRLYWQVAGAKGGRRRTVSGTAQVSIDPATIPSLKALRTMLAPVFTTAAIDSIVAEFNVREEGGTLWMNDTPEGDVSDYDNADITISQSDSTGVAADLEVPLGDSGQSDDQTVRAVRSGGTWRLATSPFGGADVDDDEGMP